MNASRMKKPPTSQAPKGRKTPARGKEQSDAALGQASPPKSSPEGAEELPVGWANCTLQDVGDIVSGGTPSTKNPEFWGGEISWISPSDLTGYKDKFIRGGAKSLTKLGLKKSSAKLMPAGSVHFSSRAPIGYVAISTQSLCTNQGFKSLVPASGIFNEYLYFYLKSIRGLANSLATGTTFKELSGSAFAKLPLPLPPLAEQKRIVAKIEELFSELDAGEENLRRARRQLGVYRQSLLKQAFEGKLTEAWREQNPDLLESPDQLLARIQAERQARYQQHSKEWEKAVKAWERGGKKEAKPKQPRKPREALAIERDALAPLPKLPAEWAWVSLGELADTTVGFAFKSKEFQKTGIRLLRGDNIEPRALRWANAMYWAEDDLDDYTDLLVSEGDIILAMDRPVISSGLKVAMARAHDTPCLLVQRVARIIGVEGIENRFLLALIDQQRFINHCLGHQTGTQLPHISEGQIRAYPVPLCSLPEQQEIVRILDAQFEVIERNEREIDAALKRSEALRQSILKKAFTGRLVPQDPADEPAAVLLEKIREDRFRDNKHCRNLPR